LGSGHFTVTTTAVTARVAVRGRHAAGGVSFVDNGNRTAG